MSVTVTQITADSNACKNKENINGPHYLHFVSGIPQWQMKSNGPLTVICIRKLTIIGLDNSLSPRRRQAII